MNSSPRMANAKNAINSLLSLKTARNASNLNVREEILSQKKELVWNAQLTTSLQRTKCRALRKFVRTRETQLVQMVSVMLLMKL
jgi:thiamine biosynthesis protein ThiC